MSDPSRSARFWDRAARKYAADPIADMVGYERTLEAVRGYVKASDVAYEFGCGTGTTALKLAPSLARIDATDISSEMIAIAREKAAAEGCSTVAFAVGTPETAPWPDGAFDVALGFNILHLIEDRPAALAAVRRVLKPGGLFLSKTVCIKEMNVGIRMALPVMQAIGLAPYVAALNAEDVEREIAAAGFEIVERARHGARGKDVRIFLAARKR
ncbi:MAG: class I SAM-dependent methyltransferase [Hyphomonadaceae bacterium]|nr:class I SAM-dependent methyltransferase [Hyphomonadaceae bacterium]